jgi:hypothetical protein
MSAVMSPQSPAATGTMTADFNTTTVSVRARCNVCYEFDTKASNADLALPYVVSVNGVVQQAQDAKPRALNRANRQIKLSVEAGSRVALFLNSDVHPDFRRCPVYAVVVGNNDVWVRIKEQKGRIGHARAVVGTATTRPPSQAGGRSTDCYDALLTGDIWMQISHKYTVEEANARLPADTPPPVSAAVFSIYRGLAQPRLQLNFPASDSATAQTLSVRFADADNALENITHCPLLTEVLPRTHPAAFAALLTEARNAGVTDMLVTSCWRPMLGSIIHRAGVGVDVTYIANASQRVHINRTGLQNKRRTSSENVSEQEKKLYQAYEEAKQRIGGKQDQIAKQQAKAEWDMERNRNEPALIHDLRERIRHNQKVEQVFDPWYMEVNTQNPSAQVSNEQRSRNEIIHANHMHLTVKEAGIL